MRRAQAVGLVLAIGVPLWASCAKRTETNNQGATVATNAAAVGKATGATVRNAINGAAATGSAANGIAKQMGKQAQELAFEVPGAVVQRIGSGIVLTLPEGLLFAQESDELTAASRDNLRRLASSLSWGYGADRDQRHRRGPTVEPSHRDCHLCGRGDAVRIA